MAVTRSVGPRSTSTDDQSVLQHSYFIALVAIMFLLVVLRIAVLRRRNQSFSGFFWTGGGSRHSYDSQPPHDSNYGSMYHGLQLAPLPAAHLPSHRVSAAATDVRGRQFDHAGEDWDGKDVLPPYEKIDRLPKYVEAGWTHGGPPPPATTPFPEGEQSGVTHSNTAEGAPADNANQPFDHTHAVAGVTPDPETLPPPVHHDSSNS